MTHAPDLLLLSMYDPVMGEVAAFEELIGSHGGLGGPQTQPFILHPAEWTLDEEVPLGAPAIYRNIRRWLESIGIRLGKAPPRPRRPSKRLPPNRWLRPDARRRPRPGGLAASHRPKGPRVASPSVARGTTSSSTRRPSAGQSA